jgi:hypothetical protein
MYDYAIYFKWQYHFQWPNLTVHSIIMPFCNDTFYNDNNHMTHWLLICLHNCSINCMIMPLHNDYTTFCMIIPSWHAPAYNILHDYFINNAIIAWFYNKLCDHAIYFHMKLNYNAIFIYQILQHTAWLHHYKTIHFA